MKAYRVGRMEGERVTASHEAEAKTPFEAAEKALGRKVTLRRGAAKWVRVIDLGNKSPTRLRPSIFEFRALEQWLTHFVAVMCCSGLAV